MSIYVFVGLAIAAMWSGSIWFAFEKGGDAREAEYLAAAEERRDEQIKEHRANTIIDMEAAADAERKRAAADRAAMQRRYALELDIERKARERAETNTASPGANGGSGDRHTCGLDTVSLGLLHGAIRDANAVAAGNASAGVPAPVPADTRAAGRAGGDHTPLDR